MTGGSDKRRMDRSNQSSDWARTMKTRLVVWALTIGVMALPEFSRAEDISLNGPWRFAYKNSLPPAKVATRFTVAVMIKPQPQMPTPDQFALDLQVQAIGMNN